MMCHHGSNRAAVSMGANYTQIIEKILISGILMRTIILKNKLFCLSLPNKSLYRLNGYIKQLIQTNLPMIITGRNIYFSLHWMCIFLEFQRKHWLGHDNYCCSWFADRKTGNARSTYPWHIATQSTCGTTFEKASQRNTGCAYPAIKGYLKISGSLFPFQFRLYHRCFLPIIAPIHDPAIPRQHRQGGEDQLKRPARIPRQG